jgi:hypothetical protein
VSADASSTAGSPTLRRLLFDVLLGDDETGGRAADVARVAGQGAELARLAWAWRVVPRLDERVRGGASLGPEGDAALSELALAAAAQSTLFWHRAGCAVRCLSDAGVAVGAFKGIGAIAALYGTPAARMVSDVDLVIDTVDVERAITALRAEGFELSEPIRDAGVHEWVESLHSPMVQLRDLFVSLRDGEGFEVDLHLRFGHSPPSRMTAPSLLGRRRTATVGRTSVPVLAPADLMVLNVYHSLKDLMALRSAARDLCDLAAWWNRKRTEWSLDDVVDAAIEAQLDCTLLTAWLLLLRADPRGPVREGVERLERSAGATARRDARRILPLVDHLLDDGRLSRGLLSTLSSQRIRRYVAERHRRTAAQSEAPGSVNDRVAGLRRVAAEAANLRRIGAYRALGRAQRGFR